MMNERGRRAEHPEDVRRSADNQMQERGASGSTRGGAKKKARGRSLFWSIIGTLVLVGVLTFAIFIGIFLTYVNKTMKGNVEFYIDEFETRVSTELYAMDPETEEWEMYQTLFSEGENRIWVSLDEIPKYLQKAAVAIEDKRFYTHHGVDPRGTLRAIFSTLTGRGVQGGSTLTQQLIKNVTGENQTTVKRKVTEIYKALECEDRYEKDEILEAYLNEVFFGESCYGAKTAALKYYGKDISELDLAECAALISITNNPSRFDPLLGEWRRENLRERQGWVLDAMLDQEMISQAEYNAAKAEDVVFTNGYTIMNNYVVEHLEEGELEEAPQETVTTGYVASNSYFTDAMIDDVKAALMAEYGYDSATAESKIFGAGYKIYTTVNPKYQDYAEQIYEDISNINYQTKDGEQLQGAMTIVDPYTGYVVAMVGGAGAKEVDRGWNWAVQPRPCGSSAKPIASYAPAIDRGIITTCTIIDDYPYSLLDVGNTGEEGKPWPKNDQGYYRGLVTPRKALEQSLNTCSVRVCSELGTWNSYEFLTQNLGLTTLTYQDSQQIGNLALGGMEIGVTTEEMAAAYASFANEGIYTKPRTFIRVEDQNGNVILENEQESHVAMKATTAAQMTSILQTVITDGIAGNAYFPGMHIAGKTGSTNDLRDRWFCGYSPYYAASCWVGYKSNTVIQFDGTNPAAVMWSKVMKLIHQDLADKPFASCEGLVQVQICCDSGKLATTNCEHDCRGSRVVTEWVTAADAPTELCDMHTSTVYDYCTEGKHFATANCPADKIVQGTALYYQRQHLYTTNEDETLNVTVATDDGICIVNQRTECPVHGGGSGPVNDSPDQDLSGFLGEETLPDEEPDEETPQDEPYSGETDDEPFDQFMGGVVVYD